MNDNYDEDATDEDEAAPVEEDDGSQVWSSIHYCYCPVAAL